MLLRRAGCGPPAAEHANRALQRPLRQLGVLKQLAVEPRFARTSAGRGVSASNRRGATWLSEYPEAARFRVEPTRAQAAATGSTSDQPSTCRHARSANNRAAAERANAGEDAEDTSRSGDLLPRDGRLAGVAPPELRSCVRKEA